MSIQKTEIQIPTREDILALLRTSPVPLTPEQLAGQLQVEANALVAFNRRLAAMERDGQLMPNRKGVLLLATKLDFVAGRVSGHRDGFGFLVRDDHAGGDIYLPPREMQKILHGDRVLVRLVGTDHRGRPEGAIVEVTERRTNRLVGRLVMEHGVMLVIPEDQRIKHDILITPGDSAGAGPGQVVTVEILQQPARHIQPIGRIVEVLGDVGDPGMEIEIAVRKYAVPYEFSEACEKEAAVLPDALRPEDYSHRVDLRDLPFVTIDGEDARDFDDAVYAEPMTSGAFATAKAPGWRLLVAIADVSHYVQPDSAIDRDAIERGTSVYFPRRVIPMLPEKLSNGLCSLVPREDRLVLVCDCVIDASGDIKAYQFYNAVIHSAARLTYNLVWEAIIDPKGPAGLEIGERCDQIEHLYGVFQTLLQARQQRHAMDLDTIETSVVCTPEGKIEKIVPRRRNDAHRLIEECMLAANVCAADFLLRSKHPCLYRVHEGPTPEKLQNLRVFLKTLNLNLSGGQDPKSADYAKLIERIAGRVDFDLLQTMILRSMQQAQYSPHNVGHFGLAYQAYTHFTSPIRRYPDLLVHRTIKALLQDAYYLPPKPEGHQEPGGHAVVRSDAPAKGSAVQKKALSQRLASTEPTWEQLGMWLSATERRADEASRDVLAWLKCYFMKERVGDSFAGHISGVAPFGLFVTLDALFVEGLVHVSELGTEYFKYNEALHELRGERSGQRYQLTDAIQVQVARVDMEARRIEFHLVTGTTLRAWPKDAPGAPAPRHRGGGRGKAVSADVAGERGAGKHSPKSVPSKATPKAAAKNQPKRASKAVAKDNVDLAKATPAARNPKRAASKRSQRGGR